MNSFVLLTDGGLRENGLAKFILEEEFKGDTLHCYLSFYSKEMELASTTEYLGQVTVAQI